MKNNSVILDKELCQGCTNCLKRCPTQAIRVRGGKAHIRRDFCIDCGECVRVCPHHAKVPVYDRLSSMEKYKYKIALPAPSFYGQFNNLDDINIVLRALRLMGFDDVYEVSAGAETVSELSRKYAAENPDKKPFISSACPTVVSLIKVRFPNLIDHLLPIKAPFELAAERAKENAVKKTGLSPEEIGTFFISPCPAKKTASEAPIGTERSAVDEVLAIKEVYQKILPFMKETANDSEELAISGKIGVSWGFSGGEAGGFLSDSYLAADGIENVIRVLEDLEDRKFTDLDFIELNACSGGCVGGVLTVENPYVAKSRMKSLRQYMPVTAGACNHGGKDSYWTTAVEFEDIYKLSSDFGESMAMLARVEELAARLPGLDCGTCGAPTCMLFAEDVVRGYAEENDCIYMLKEHLQDISDSLNKLNSLK
ncbi:MAG: [Fe-Fe] hydrogenase large subunit C-terminal domain-containing protein [Oscillospiraceae bacterium]